MPVTLSYDLQGASSNQRNYVRSMFERFGWKRLGGSVLRYDGRMISGVLQEDWLNDVVPSVMLFRAYVIKHNIPVGSFTLDSMSISRVELGFGRPPRTGAKLSLKTPTNRQSSVKSLRDFVDAATQAAP